MRLLLLVVSIVFALSACVAGPTPHPGQEETDPNLGAPSPDPSAPSVQEGQDASTGGIGGEGSVDENTADALDDGDGTDGGDTATDVEVVGDTATDVGPEPGADVVLDTSSD